MWKQCKLLYLNTMKFYCLLFILGATVLAPKSSVTEFRSQCKIEMSHPFQYLVLLFQIGRLGKKPTNQYKTFPSQTTLTLFFLSCEKISGVRTHSWLNTCKCLFYPLTYNLFPGMSRSRSGILYGQDTWFKFEKILFNH